jgi:hypothetical protein
VRIQCSRAFFKSLPGVRKGLPGVCQRRIIAFPTRRFAEALNSCDPERDQQASIRMVLLVRLLWSSGQVQMHGIDIRQETFATFDIVEPCIKVSESDRDTWVRKASGSGPRLDCNTIRECSCPKLNFQVCDAVRSSFQTTSFIK